MNKATTVARRCHWAEEGYSLVELLAALTVFAIVFAAVSLGIGSALNVNRTNRIRSTAAYVAAQQLEQARGMDFEDILPGQTRVTSGAFTITQDVAWVSAGSTTSSCDVPSGSSGTGLAYKRVSVRVEWANMRGVAPVRSQTVITPPAGAYDPAKGHIAVSMSDRAGSPLAGQVVNLAGATTGSQVTTEDGCVFFAYLAPGSYTVRPLTTGYVDRQGEQPTLTTSVVGGQVSKVIATYDRAATLAMTLLPPAGPPAAVVPDNIPVTVFNTALTPDLKSFAGTGTTRTVGPLFPFADGYQAWAGDCTDADPGVAARGAFLTTNPGGSGSGTAALDAVDVVVNRTLTLPLRIVPVSGIQVRAVNVSGAGCSTAGRTLTSSLARTDANGRVRLALPYGTWRLEATTGTITASTVTLTPASAAIETRTVVVL